MVDRFTHEDCVVNDTVLRTAIFRCDPKNRDASAPTTPLIIDFKETFRFFANSRCGLTKDGRDRECLEKMSEGNSASSSLFLSLFLSFFLSTRWWRRMNFLSHFN